MDRLDAVMARIDQSVSRCMAEVAKSLARPVYTLWELRRMHDAEADALARNLLSAPAIQNDPEGEIHIALEAIVNNAGLDIYTYEDDIIEATQEAWTLIEVITSREFVREFTSCGRNKHQIDTLIAAINVFKSWLLVTESILDAFNSCDHLRRIQKMVQALHSAGKPKT